MKQRYLILSLASVLFVTGCWSFNPVDRAVNRAVDSAADRVGQRVGEAVAANILANNPELLYSYTMSVYGMMFYQGGYSIEAEPYEEGEYTQWKSSGVKEADWFEKTLLKRFPNGREWWRVETRSTDSSGNKHVVIMETLFSEPNDVGGRKILRMRALLPGDENPREIAVRENDSRNWQFNQTTGLTEESKEGMKVGEEQIEVPAGIFDTEHLQASYGGDGHMDWWITENVSGGLVKYSRVPAKDASTSHEVVLLDFGGGRTQSKLGVDLSQGGGEDVESEEQGEAEEVEETEESNEDAEATEE